MDLPKEDLEEVRQGRVLRVANPRHVAPGTELPHPALFALDEKDVREARETGRPPMLSVFDRDRTTLSEAKGIVAPDGELFAFELKVAQVWNLTRLLPPRAAPIQVLRNLLLPEAKADLPGILGHCGITGLLKEPGMPKKTYQSVRDELCQLAQLVEE